MRLNLLSSFSLSVIVDVYLSGTFREPSAGLYVVAPGYLGEWLGMLLIQYFLFFTILVKEGTLNASQSFKQT